MSVLQLKPSKMKKKLIGLFTTILLFTGALFANEGTQPSKQVQKEFDRAFAQSKEVKWEKIADFYKVSFLLGDQYLTAIFSPSNRIESVSRNISIATLPLTLQKGIQDKLSDLAWVTECIELSGKNGTEYYATVENADQKIAYHSNGHVWSVFKITEK
jgi:hypothetical protein